MYQILSKILPRRTTASYSTINNSSPETTPIESQTPYQQIKSDYDPKKLGPKKKKKIHSDLNLLYRLIHLNMPMILSGIVIFGILIPNVLCEANYRISESGVNPYSVYEQATARLLPSASESRPHFVSRANKTYARRSPQWGQQTPQQSSSVPHQYGYTTNHHVMVNTGKSYDNIRKSTSKS